MSELIDRQALRAAHGLGSDCHDCKLDMKSCQYDRDYSLMDFCEWLDDAPTASPWHRVEDELPEIGKRVLVSYGGYVQILKRTDGMTFNGRNYWWNEADGLWEQVEKGSYWMPIEPPKEDA